MVVSSDCRYPFAFSLARVRKGWFGELVKKSRNGDRGLGGRSSGHGNKLLLVADEAEQRSQQEEGKLKAPAAG